ncbi:histidine phosphatase family protein [Streptomyces sp. NPDC059340]|uniref:histidine phosphatase family protein n=1 Tax=Streptomyces sp. NPDC059340 TaxID=3346806 RepID=UPI003678422C
MTTNFVYFIRHARSHANQQNLLIGRKGAHELNDVGLRQAVSLGERLKSQGVRAFRTSPLRRAVQTAHILGDTVGSPTPVVDEDLIERDFGRFDGMDRPTLLDTRSRLGLDNQDPTGYFPTELEDVEPVKDVQSRMTQAWQRAVALVEPGESAGVISHAGTIKALLYGALGIDERQPRAFKVFQASYVKCKVPDEGRLTVHEIWVNPVQ